MNRNLSNALYAGVIAILCIVMAGLMWDWDRRGAVLLTYLAMFSATLCGGSLAYWWFWVRP